LETFFKNLYEENIKLATELKLNNKKLSEEHK